MVAGSQIPVGGAVIFSDGRYSGDCSGNNSFAVAQPSAGTFVAVSAGCTHACCQVDTSHSGYLYCPCHRAHFAYDGSVLSGPNNGPLPTIPTCYDGCNVYVQLA